MFAPSDLIAWVPARERQPRRIAPIGTVREWLDDYDEDAEGSGENAGRFRASQAIRATMKLFSGAYIGRDMAFLRRVAAFLPEKFPRAGKRSVKRCRAFVWAAPDELKAAA